jgi:hypothetical protein
MYKKNDSWKLYPKVHRILGNGKEYKLESKSGVWGLS